MLKVIVASTALALSYVVYQRIQTGSAKYAEFLTRVKHELQGADLTKSEKGRVLECVEKVGYPTAARTEYCMGRKPFSNSIIQFLEKVYNKKVVARYASAKKKFLFSDWNCDMFTEPVIQHNYEEFLVHTIVFI
jgi:hypothetical protein